MRAFSQIYGQIRLFIDSKDMNGLACYFRGLDDANTDIPSSLLVMKARAIQIAEDSCGYTLEDAEKFLLEAIEADKNNLEAYIELGYFYYAVADESTKAMPLFEQSIECAEAFLLMATLGKAKVLVDLEKMDEAQYFLRQSYFANHPDVIEFTNENISS